MTVELVVIEIIGAAEPEQIRAQAQACRRVAKPCAEILQPGLSERERPWKRHIDGDSEDFYRNDFHCGRDAKVRPAGKARFFAASQLCRLAAG
jgi:hypothetical protein